MVRVDGSGNSQSLIRVRGLNKTYSRGGEKIQVLQGLNLDVDKGDFVAFMGPSGSGKTTLLNLLGGLDVPSAGSITVDGDEITHMSGSKLTQWRARHVGFIFQMYNLIPVLTAFQNVELPLLLTKLSKADRRKHVETALGVVGLTDRMQHYPRQLSGGQEQRVTIARAIVSDPTFLLCDEPTGDLDRKSADEVMALIEELVGKYGKTVLMVTHDPVVAARAHITLHLEKGVLVEAVQGRAGRGGRRRVMKFSALIFANLFRKKIRLVLTVGSFAVALFLFAFLAVVRNAFNRGADVAGADRLVVIDRVSIINLIPLKYRDQILQIPGVKSITHNNWFGGVYQDEKNFFPQFVIDPENQRQVFPELIVPDDQWNAFLKDRQGAIAGAARRSAFTGRSVTAYRSRPLYTEAAPGNSTWTAFITDSVPRTMKPSSGSSGIILKSASRSKSKDRLAGTFSGSTIPMMPCASPKPSTINSPTLRVRRKQKRNPLSPRDG